MDAFLQSIKESLELSDIVPAVVDEKCREAYKSIREMPAVTVKKKKHLATKICLPIVACFALIFGIGFINPALADQIPIVKNVIAPIQNVFEMFRSNDIKNKDPLLHGNQAEYAQPVVMNSESTDSTQLKIKVEQLYCDGYNLNITYSMELSDKTLRQYDALEFFNETYMLNGQQIDKRMLLTFKKNRDLTFVAVQQFDLSRVTNLTDTFDFSVSLTDMRGIDYDQLVKEECPSPQNPQGVDYVPKETPLSGKWDFDFQGSVDRSGNHIYTIGETNNEMKLDTIILTPSSTIVTYELPKAWSNNPDNYVNSTADIVDDKGNGLQPSLGRPTRTDDAFIMQTTYSETPPDATSLAVKITVKDKQPAEFTVPLK